MKSRIYFILFVSLFSCQSHQPKEFDENFIVQLEKNLLQNAKVDHTIHSTNWVWDFNYDGIYDGYETKEDYFEKINTQEIVDILKSYGAILDYEKESMEILKILNIDYLKKIYPKYVHTNSPDNPDSLDQDTTIFYLTEISTDDFGENFYFVKFKTNKEEYGYILYFTDKKLLQISYYE